MRLVPRALLCLALLQAGVARADETRVRVPVYFDYLLLEQVLTSQLFNTPDGSREIVNDPKGCNRVVLSEPRLAPQQQDLQIIARASVQLGAQLFGDCLTLLDWDGGVGFLGRPVIEPGGRAVSLEPLQSWLIGNRGGRLSSGPLFDLARPQLRAFFAGFRLDLSPYLDSLGGFLPAVLPRQSAQQLQATADSLALGDLRMGPANLKIAIDFTVDTLPIPPEPAGPLTEEELRQFEARWQMMDALLVGAVKHYAAATELEALRSQLLDVLIDSRYRLRNALAEQDSAPEDAVRAWFVVSWHKLAPVVRRIALEQPGQAHLLWFSALTAADALYALDKLGPGIGLEISTDGLRRLARMISAGDADDMLRFDEEVDPQLQELFQEQLDYEDAEAFNLRFRFSLFPRAHAAEQGKLSQWVAKKDNLDVYLPKVASLMELNSGKLLKQHKLAPQYAALYPKLVLATAWQESCWRQYIIRDQRIEPLISSSGDTGLMQVNERVWRGFYDLQKLRWDIVYNNRAGAEILLNYMLQYAIKKGEHKQPGGIANLARASYSAYNGGPGQYSRYRKSNVKPALKKVDQLFWEKYRQVDNGKALNVAGCLGAELTGPS